MKERIVALLALAVCLALSSPAPGADAAPKVGDATKDADGILVHVVESDYQDKPTTIRVLLPGKMEQGRRYRVLYVLPVEAGNEKRFGDGLLEVKKLGLPDRYGLICVQPTFARLPWYADHPTDPKIRQESYFLKVVVPFVEEKYPALARPEGRLLLGFSKSGWGAFSLLLRHPDVFGKAAAWDAPLMMDAPGKYGSGEIFGTKDNFEHYRVIRLLEAKAGKLGDGKRLAVLGYGGFRADHKAVHALMEQGKVEHEYADGPPRKHDWHSGWVAEAVEFLVKPRTDGPEPGPDRRP
jgi:hypothetical protein